MKRPTDFSAAGFTQPPGWEKEEVRTPSDPYVAFSSGADTIKVRLIGGGGSRYASEEFVLVPRGRKFFVLSWAHESPVPDPDSKGEKAWEAFLSSFTLRSGPVSRDRR